jgi:hypothetical protein
MLETSYTLNLEQLIKIILELRIYLWQKMKVDKPHMNTWVMNEKVTMFVIRDISTTIVAINNHMAVIEV